MAKKAAKSKTKRASAGKKGYRVPVHAVLAFAKMLRDEGHDDKFGKNAKKSSVALTMDAKAVAFVRKYLDDKKLHPKAAQALKIRPQRAKAMAARPTDPCPCVDR
jgi:hypothetical protein